jgi:predicted protein tyrosine phosphatase
MNGNFLLNIPSHFSFFLKGGKMTMENRKTEIIDLKIRTKNFALLIIHFYSGLPKSTVAQLLGNQGE